MACSTSRLALSAAAAVLLAVVLSVSGGAATATASSAPSYCTPGKAIPYNPLPGCVWYAATRSCDDMAVSVLPVLKEMCCGQLEHVPAECRCRALRVMMEAPLVVGTDPAAQRRCRAAQHRFAPNVAAECGLPTGHGRPFCNALDAE